MMYFYHLLSFLLLPVYLVLLIGRVINGKEDIKRIGERFAISKAYNNKDGTLVWLHAASLGESLIAITLVENINNLWLTGEIPSPFLRFLVTSGTNSSARLLQQKLPKNAIHQFVPIDNIMFVKKFFSNWRPSLGIFIESELWPVLISQGSNYCSLLLLNARLSDSSFGAWKKLNYFFKLIVNKFSHIVVQSQTDLQKFIQLGVTENITNLGNIKFANKQLPVDKSELGILSNHIGNKKIIVFASTHLEDEQRLLNIIKPLKERYPDCYIMLIPRHPERKNEIGKMCNNLRITYNLKSEHPIPIMTDDLYIIDTFGELGLFFSLAYITFIGGSFKHGGHNIVEPAYFSNYIIFGPDMSNFVDMANSMIHHKAATQIHSEDELLNKLYYLLSEEGSKEVNIYRTNVLKFVNKNQQIVQDYLTIIKQYLGEK